MKGKGLSSVKDGRINVRLPPHLEYWLNLASEDLGIGRAEIVRSIMASFLTKDDRDQQQLELLKSMEHDAFLDVEYQVAMLNKKD